MSEAPERIWAEDVDKDWSYGSGAWGCDREEIHEVEYIRADIHEARVKELEACVKELEPLRRRHPGF